MGYGRPGGNPDLPKGRAKGQTNLATRRLKQAYQRAEDVARLAGFEPIQAIIDIHRIAMEMFVEERQKLLAGKLSPMEDQSPKYLGIAAQTAGKVADYIHPKLKHIEVKATNPLDNMSPKEKLEAMKTAVKALELKAEQDKEPQEVPNEPGSDKQPG